MGVALLAMGGSAAKDGLTFTIVGGVLTAISIVVAIACTATPPASTLAA
jgi:hypothetical protein